MAVQYPPDAPSTAPATLFLKTGASDAVEHDDWRAEVQFYQALAPGVSAALPCYHAAYAAAPARFQLLLAVPIVMQSATGVSARSFTHEVTSIRWLSLHRLRYHARA